MTTMTDTLAPYRECPPEVTPEQCRRVQIALKALEDITAGRFVADDVVYLRRHGPSRERCAGCLIGSLALARWGSFDAAWDQYRHHLPIEPSENHAWILVLSDAFGGATAQDMENCFQWGWALDQDRLYMFTPDHSADYRVRSILSNIIRNRGDFDRTTRVEPIR